MLGEVTYRRPQWCKVPQTSEVWNILHFTRTFKLTARSGITSSKGLRSERLWTPCSGVQASACWPNLFQQPKQKNHISKALAAYSAFKTHVGTHNAAPFCAGYQHQLFLTVTWECCSFSLQVVNRPKGHEGMQNKILGKQREDTSVQKLVMIFTPNLTLFHYEMTPLSIPSQKDWRFCLAKFGAFGANVHRQSWRTCACAFPFYT